MHIAFLDAFIPFLYYF